MNTVDIAKKCMVLRANVRDLNNTIEELLSSIKSTLIKEYDIKKGDTILVTEYENRKVFVVSLELVESRFFEYGIMVENKTEKELLDEKCTPYSLVAHCLHYTKMGKVERGRNTKRYYIDSKSFKKDK